MLIFPRRRFSGGALRDGLYRLLIRADRIRDASGQSLDGGDRTTVFRLRFGDGDGDGRVGRLDRALFRRALGSRKGAPGFAAHFDGDGNDKINRADAALFARSARRR